MAELMTETLLYQSYQRAVREKAKFDVVFTSGAKLAIFYQSKNRGEEYDRTWNELFEIFATNMSASKQSVVLKEFFTMVLGEIFENRYDSRIAQMSADKVYEKMKANKAAEAYEFATYLDKYTHLQGGWRSTSKVESGFQVVLHLSGRSNGTQKVSDSKLYASVVELCRIVLSEVLVAARDLNVQFLAMPLKQLNDIVTLLGEQQNYNDLEWLLTELWESREQQSSWDSMTIVWIGRRLVETRFASGRRDAAIHLCEDICYNVRRVWGSSDRVTVEMYNLLASLYTTIGDHAKALAVHEDVCRQTLTVVEDGDIEPAQGAEITKTQLELMKRSYQRIGGWGAGKDGNEVKELYSQLQQNFGSEKSFSSVQSVDKWSAKEKADNVGVWSKPSTFDFLNATDLKHRNYLSRSSGLVYQSPKHQRGSSASYSYSYSSSSNTNGTNGKA